MDKCIFPILRELCNKGALKPSGFQTRQDLIKSLATL